jgi:hypothetical protein
MVLPLGAFLGSRSEARDITYFSGGAAGFTVDITPPGTVAPNSLVLPQYSYVSSASLKVSTHAGGDPRAPADISLDVGGDGSPEWAFNGTGAGAFGFQDQASDGSTSLTLRYDRKGYQSFSVRLPSGANVTNATLDISGALDNVTFGTANVTGANDFDLFGISVAGGVDINGDGYDDVMVGAPDGDTHGLTDNGYLNVYYGSLNGPSTVPGDTLSGAESGDAFGFSCAGVHDFNGDGYGEVLAGAPLATPKPSVVPATGVAYLYAYDGVQGRFRNLPIHTISGSGESGQMGFSVAEVADIDRDNRSDIAGGEILANRSVVQPYLGRVAVLRSSDPTGNPDNLWGDAAYSFFGCFMAKARDLDGDKKADFLVGAKINTPSGPMGSVYLFLSRQDFKNPTVILGTQGWSTFGTSGCTGDFNGDGFEDIAIGAPDTRFGGDDKTFGAVLIYSGDPKGIDPLQKPMVLRGRQNGTEYGYSLACPGDLDGDGTDDLLIGIPGSITNSSGDPGAVDVFLTGRALNITLNGDFTDEHFGLSVAAAGDVNRDGLRDFVVGAPTAPLGNRSAVGRAITFLTRLAGPWNPKMNVGDTGADDWSWQGPFVRGVRVPDFSKKLNALLFGAQSVSVDGYGNEFTDVTISVYSDRPGAMTISNISIAYNWTATVDVNPESASGNLTWALNNLLTHARSDPPDQLIPLVFNATSAGAVTVRGLEVTIDEAPVARAAPVVTMHEDGSDAYLLDLYTIFSDDHDGGDLLFTIDDYTNGDFVQVSLTDQRWLSVDAYNGTENDNWTGETVVHVSAGDSRWLFNSTDVTVQIAPVNDPPAFTSSPPLGARAGARYVYQLTAVDAENGTLSYGLLNGPAGMRVGRSSGLVEWIPAQAQFNQTFEVELFVSDGELCATQSFSVTVGTRLDGVGMAGTPPPTAVVGEEYLFDPRGFTDVPNATVTFNILSGPAGMSVLPNGTLRWVPAESQVGTAAVQLEATDGYFTSTLGWNISVFEAGTPRSGLTCAIREPAEGKKVSGKVTFRGVANITVGAISGVEVRVDRKDWTEAAGLADWSYVLDTTKLSNGRHTVYARAWDGKSHSQNATVTVDVENVQASAGLLSGPLLWLALAVVIIAAAAVMVALYLRRPAPKAPPGAPPAAVRNGEELAVEDVFLILLDGRLIHHATRRLAIGVDSDILSSMLTAVTSFVKDALARTGEGNLGSLEYGENKIILERGRWTFIAVVITGRREPPELRDEMKQAIANVESEYASVLPGWDGNHAALSSVKKFLGPVTSFTMAQAAASGAVNAAGVDVTVSGELEFYQGYVRLKVAVKNSSPAFIMDSALRIIYNDKALRLERIEPEYPVTGREIMLGNIGIREKKTVALYLDPQICTESRIEGTLTFKDAQGEMHHADMKRKLASVVCPIMYSDQNINVPMLQRLLESELDQKDSKVFSLPQGLGPEGAFELCKRAVQGHDIRLVREFVDREPFVGEAWYFGKVKGRGDRLVVKTAVRADTASAEFYVASNSRLVVTGLLAELKNDLNKEYRREKGGESDVEAMADESRRERVRKAGSLLDKYAQGEAAPGSIGPPEMNR